MFVVVGIIIIGFGVYYFTQRSSNISPVGQVTSPTLRQDQVPVTTTPVVQTNDTQAPVDNTKTVLGTSVQNRDITAYHYGTGDTELLFVGGIHGGYEWNTTLVAYDLMDYLAANPSVIPANVKVTVIPVLNPDGLNKVVGTTNRFASTDVSTSKDTVVAGRFNSNNVDLNRNFDCDWQTTGVWQNTPVSGGSAAFSEPESQAIRTYIENKNPVAVVVWYSAAGGVFASSCHNGVSAGTRKLTDTFAAASKYKAYDSFDFYATTGDMVNWLAKKNIPAISVILTTHDGVEWSKNQAGIDAMLKLYAK